MNFTCLKKKLINLTLLAVSLVVFFVLMEGVLVFYSVGDEDNYGFTKEFYEKYVRYNKHGYRDYEYSLEKPEGVFRVLVLGDSQTFGHGIKELKDTWVKKLEAKLKKERNDSKIEILNISGPGWNSDTHLYELFKHGFNFNSDLVILAYYHNDIATPSVVDCDSNDHKIIPDIMLVKNSKLVSWVNFRINRLLEGLKKKQRYSDCLNQIYDSVGWEMEKFYLDIMRLALFIKKIHFMVTVIPIIHQLDDHYPLTGPHKKLEEFLNQREIVFLDLYEKGFKNLDADHLTISKTDHHLNQRANDIIANTLFNRLRGLATYNNLSYFHKAFSLKEVLDEYPKLKKLDNLFSKTNSTIKFSFNSENEEFQIVRDTDQITVKKILKEPNGSNPIELLKTRLNSKGSFIQLEKVVFYPNSTIPKARDTIFKHSDTYIQTIEKIVPDSKGTLTAVQLEQRQYQFDFLGNKKYKTIRLEKGIFLPDPKLLDKWIFQNVDPPSNWHSRTKQKEILIGMITKNPNIYDTPDDIKILKQPDSLDKLSDKEMARYFDERSLFQIFLILNRYGAKKYVNLLLELIEQYKPSFTAINAAKRFRSHTQR